MISQINQLNSANINRSLLNVWKQSIDSLERARVFKSELSRVWETPAKPKPKLKPVNLINQYDTVSISLNRLNQTKGVSQGLLENLNRERLSIASKLAEQKIYV